MSYGGEVAPLEVGFMRRYTETIYTGADRFDTRRFGGDSALPTLEESSFEFDLSNMDFSFGGDAPAEDEESDPLESSSLDHSAWDMDTSGFASEVDELWDV